MKYDVLITEIINESSRKVLAHQLARDPGVSFQDALNKLQKLPVVLFKDIDRKTMSMYVEQYHKYGVRLKAVPAQDHAENETPLQDMPLKPSIASVPGPKLESRTNHLQSHPSPDGPVRKVQVPFYQTTEVVKKKKKISRNDLILLLTGILFLFVIILLGLSNKRGTLRIVSLENNRNNTTDMNLRNDQKKQQGQNEKPISNSDKRKTISGADREKSSEMCDSAEMVENDILKLINFYKIAISFNRYNCDAWFGLLAAYKSAGMNREYKETYNTIKKLFGNEVFEITSQISRFGDIEDMYESENGVLILKYNVRNGDIEEIEEDAYSLVKILNANYNYQSISIVVSDKKKERMVVHIRPDMEIATFGDFKKNASLTVFGK